MKPTKSDGPWIVYVPGETECEWFGLESLALNRARAREAELGLHVYVCEVQHTYDGYDDGYDDE